MPLPPESSQTVESSERAVLDALPESDNLYAIAVEIVAARSGSFSGSLNEAIHAQVMDWFSMADLSVGSAIHNAQISPISVSGLMGRRRAKNVVKAGDLFSLRVGILQGSLLSILLAGLEAHQATYAAELSLDGFPFKLKQILALPGSSHLVGASQYSLLTQLPQTTPALTLRFVSPTSFRQQRHVQPFPLPHTVFSGLQKRWNKFAPNRFALPRIDWQSFAASYDLKTRSVYLKGKPQVGAEGRVTYRFTDPEQARIAHQLAHFANFAGVGRKTAMGMGQTRLKT